MPMDIPEDAANTFDCENLQNRQTNFISNSCRTYEIWGYHWWITSVE